MTLSRLLTSLVFAVRDRPWQRSGPCSRSARQERRKNEAQEEVAGRRASSSCVTAWRWPWSGPWKGRQRRDRPALARRRRQGKAGALPRPSRPCMRGTRPASRCLAPSSPSRSSRTRKTPVRPTSSAGRRGRSSCALACSHDADVAHPAPGCNGPLGDMSRCLGEEALLGACWAGGAAGRSLSRLGAKPERLSRSSRRRGLVAGFDHHIEFGHRPRCGTSADG